MKNVLWKKIIFFIIVLFLFIFPSFLFRKDVSFYKEISLPSFAPKPIIFGIVWTILYVIQSLYITYVYFNIFKVNSFSTNDKKNLEILLIINFIFNILYMPIFFKFHLLFGSLLICTFVLLSLLLIIIKSKEMKIKYWYLEIPYLIWAIFATILAGSIFFIN